MPANFRRDFDILLLFVVCCLDFLRLVCGAFTTEKLQQTQGRVRVTFLVNVWLSHKPLGIAPLPQALAATISRAPDLPPLDFDHSVTFAPVKLPVNDDSDIGASDRDALVATVGVKAALGTATFLEMCVPRSETWSARERRGLHAFVLRLEDGFRARISGFDSASSCGGQVRRDADCISCPAKGFDRDGARREEQVGSLAEEQHDHAGTKDRAEGSNVNTTANAARERQGDTTKRKRDDTYDNMRLLSSTTYIAHTGE